MDKVPIQPDVLDELVSRGRVISATRHGSTPAPIGEIDSAVDSTDVISELRDER